MSEDSVAAEVEAERCCANCGKAEIDDVKLSDCDKCDLAKYCGDDCQQNHQEKHEAACKERAVELRDELLFTQNESSYLGDCPICFLPIPLDVNESGASGMMSCCGKIICRGCDHANQMYDTKEGRKCAFCRKVMPDTDKEAFENHEKRAEVNDPAALRRIGNQKDHEGDYDSAFEYFNRAAELGDAMAHYNLSIMYKKGEGVEKDEEKGVYHLEEAAIAGHPGARYNLGVREAHKNRFDRAVKHFIIAANLGHSKSLQVLKGCYKVGEVSKDDLAATFRAHQAAVDAMKSPQREAAAAEYLASKTN